MCVEPYMYLLSSFAIILVTAFALLVNRWKALEHSVPWSSTISVTARPASYALNGLDVGSGFERISTKPPSHDIPDTTAVVLNWSRLPNVIRIVSLLCQSSLDKTIAEIVVWNNSPKKLTPAVGFPSHSPVPVLFRYFVGFCQCTMCR